MPVFKEDTVEPSESAWDLNLKAYTAINLTQMIRRDLALNQDPLGQCSQLARTVRDTTISATAAGL